MNVGKFEATEEEAVKALKILSKVFNDLLEVNSSVYIDPEIDNLHSRIR